MKIRLIAFLCLAAWCHRPSAEASPAVDFNSAIYATSVNMNMNGFTSGVSSVPYSETTLRNPSSGNYNTTGDPSGYFYGGAITNQSTGITNYTVQKTGTTWPSNNWFYAQAGGTGTGTVLNNYLSVLTMWKKEDFDNGLERGLTQLGDGTAVLNVRHRPGLSGLTNTLRLVVKRADNYYVSSVFSTATGTSVTTASLSDLSTLTWFSYDPVTNVNTIGAAATPGSLRNIDAMGILATSTVTNTSFTNPPKMEIGEVTLRGASENTKPVLLIGPWYTNGTTGASAYGTTEAGEWIRSVLAPHAIDFKFSQQWVEPALWSGNYSAVIACNSTGLLNPPTDSSGIISYVNNGGTLILIEDAAGQMSPGTSITTYAGLFGADTRASKVTASGTTVFSATDDVYPWAKDSTFVSPAFPVKNDGVTTGGRAFGRFTHLTTAKAIMQGTSGQGTFMSVNHYGKGHLVLLGMSLMRLYGDAAGEWGLIAKPAYAAALQKLILNLGVGDDYNMNMPQIRTNLSTTDNFVAWRGDSEDDYALYAWDTVSYYPRFSPPWPESGEKMPTSGTAIQADMGRTEVYSVPFNIFALEDIANMQVSITAASGYPAIPTGGVKIYVQKPLNEEADPNNIVAMDQQRFWLKPIGSGTAIPYGRNAALWLKFDSTKWTHSGSSPVTYNMTLTLNDGTVSRNYLVSLKIHPVTIGGTSGLTISRNSTYQLGLYDYYTINGATFNWPTVVGSGNTVNHSYNYTGNTSATTGPASLIMDSAQEIGTFTINGSGIDHNSVKLTTGPYAGKTLKQFGDIKASTDPSATIFTSGNTVQPLNFSGYDRRVAAGLDRKAFRIQIRSGLIDAGSASNNLVSRLTGIAYGPATGAAIDPVWETVNTQIWTQFRIYLTSGNNTYAPGGVNAYTDFVHKYSDELGRTTIENNWYPYEKTVKAAGWKPEVNLTNESVMNKDLFEAIDDVVGVLQLNENWVNYWMTTVKPLVVLPSGLEIKSYGSWGYFKAPPSRTRKQWWKLWSEQYLTGIDYYSMQFISLVEYDGTNRTIYTSPGFEGVRNGWYDAAYLKLLRERWTAASASTWKTNVTSFFNNWIAANSTSTKSAPYWHGAYWGTMIQESGVPDGRPEIIATTQQLEESRKNVLDLLSSQP